MLKRCLDLDYDGTTTEVKLVLIDIFIDRSVATRLTLFLPLSYTVTDLKKKILLEHEHFYPEIGALTINQLVIERPGMTCYLHSSDMLVRKAFEGHEEDWHLFVDASSSEVVKDFANPLHPPYNTGKTEFADPLHPCNKGKTECPRLPLTTVCKSCGESSRYGLEFVDVDDAWSKGPDGPVVCVTTSLNTNLIVNLSFSDTVADFKKKVVHKHEERFPKTGALSINELQVEYKGDMYSLLPNTPLRLAFKGVEHWSLFADVVAPAVAAKHLKEGKREAEEVIEKEVSKKKQKKKDVATKEARVKTEKKKVVKKQESSDDSSEEQKVVKGKVADAAKNGPVKMDVDESSDESESDDSSSDDDAPPKKVPGAVPKKATVVAKKKEETSQDSDSEDDSLEEESSDEDSDSDSDA